MALFAVMADNSANLESAEAAIARVYPDSNYRFGHRSWVIAQKGKTAQTISREMGMSDEGASLTGIAILQLSGTYWGRADAAFWDWLKRNFEANDG